MCQCTIMKYYMLNSTHLHREHTIWIFYITNTIGVLRYYIAFNVYNFLRYTIILYVVVWPAKGI